MNIDIFTLRTQAEEPSNRLEFNLESHFENTSNVSLRVTVGRQLKNISEMKLLKLGKIKT